VNTFLRVGLGLTLCALLSCAQQQSEPQHSALEPLSTRSEPVLTNQVPVQPPVAKEPTASADARCATLCAHAAPLGCGSELGCMAVCGEMRSSPVCGHEIAQFLECAAARARIDWECGDDDMPALRDQVCEQEQAGLASCLQKHIAPK
jgi:hypothetical protein